MATRSHITSLGLEGADTEIRPQQPIGNLIERLSGSSCWTTCYCSTLTNTHCCPWEEPELFTAHEKVTDSVGGPLSQQKAIHK